MKNAIRTALVVCFMALTSAQSSSAQLDTKPRGVIISKGFLDGTSWASMSDRERAAYAMGFANGMFVSPLLGQPGPSLQRLATCLDPMTNIQVAAIISKYIADHPERWHQSLNGLGFSALYYACGLDQQQIQ